MTSQLNLEDIYTDLNNLLKDVCSFLTTEAQNGTLSAKAKNEAERLVSRSRQQVEIVTKLSVIQESSNSNYPYLEMLPGGGAEEPLSEYVPAEIADYNEPELYEESYAPVDNEPIIPPPPTSIVNEDKNLRLYTDLPLSMIEERSVKYGPLCRKERYLFIEQKKQYMAGLVGYYLLIYALNKKEQKPIQIINLLNYSARSIEQRKDPAFEICAENEKTHEFIARSIKDMEQWVVAINCKKHICTNGRDLPEIPLVTISPEFDNSDRNSNQINSDSQNVMHYGSDEEIYASVEDFGKPEIVKQISAPTTEDFPKLPPRSFREIRISPKISAGDNTYNNLEKQETEVNDGDDDTNSKYELVQCSDTQEQKNNEEEPLEIYNELKVTETVNRNVRIPSFSNTNTKQLQNDEDLEDYNELKPIPCKYQQPTKVTAEISSEEGMENVLKAVSQNYKQNKPMDSTTSKVEEIEDNNVQNSQNKPNISVQIKSAEEEEEELVDYDELKPISSIKPTQSKDNLEQEKPEVSDEQSKSIENMTKKIENSNDTKLTKPSKPMKKFWEKRLSESSKKETEDDESRRSVANIKSKFNAQSSLSAQEKLKPPITSPKPKSQTLLNKFPSFSKNKNSKDEDGNSNVQNIRQQLEQALSFRNLK